MPDGISAFMGALFLIVAGFIIFGACNITAETVKSSAVHYGFIEFRGSYYAVKPATTIKVD